MFSQCKICKGRMQLHTALTQNNTCKGYRLSERLSWRVGFRRGGKTHARSIILTGVEICRHCKRNNAALCLGTHNIVFFYSISIEFAGLYCTFTFYMKVEVQSEHCSCIILFMNKNWLTIIIVRRVTIKYKQFENSK